MSDLERRLRAAMIAAAEQPPAGLMQAIRRRHRRHIRRGGTAIATAATAAPHAAPTRQWRTRCGPAMRRAASPQGLPPRDRRPR